MIDKSIDENAIETKYENKFNDLSLGEFNIAQRRILMALLTRSRDKGFEEKICLSKQDLIDLNVYLPQTHITRKKFERDLRKTLKACQSLHFHSVMRKGNYNHFEFIPLFIRIVCDFTDDLSDVKLEFELNPYFVPLLKDVFQNYTIFRLSEYQSLRSIYSQTLYRCLKQYEATGKWIVSRDELLALLEVPESYAKREDLFTRKVLNPALKELTHIFPNLKMQKKRQERGSGRRITGYEFSWTSRHRDSYKANSVRNVPPKKTKFYIPKDGDLPAKELLEEFKKESGIELSLREMRDILSGALERGAVSNWRNYLQGAAKNRASSGTSKKKSNQEFPDWWYAEDEVADDELIRQVMELQEQLKGDGEKGKKS